MSKQIFRAVLGAAVIIGIAALCAGCPTEGGGGGGAPYNLGGNNDGTDTWSNVTSLSQLNGTWKGSVSYTEDFDREKTIKVTHSEDDTLIVNASTKTMTVTGTMTQTYSGGNIANRRNEMKNSIIPSGISTSDNGTIIVTNISFNDANHSVKYTITITALLTDKQTAELLAITQISQDRKKIKTHGALRETYDDEGTLISEEGGYDLILTKQ